MPPPPIQYMHTCLGMLLSQIVMFFNMELEHVILVYVPQAISYSQVNGRITV